MGKENRSTIIIDLAGNIAARAPQFARDLANFASVSQRSMNQLGRAGQLAGERLDGMGNRYTAVAAAFASTQIVRGVTNFDSRLTQLGINADLTDEQLSKVKDTVFEISRHPEIHLDPSEMLAAVEQITSRTGKLNVAMDNLENVGELMRATGTDAQSAGDLVADFYEKFDIKNPADMKEVLSSLAKQGKAGAFDLKDLATESAQVSDAFATTGMKGKDAALQMGAMLQMIRRTTASSSEASVAFSRMLQTMTTERLEDLRKHGIEIFDPQKLAAGVKVMRPIPDILKDIIDATQGDQEKLSGVFDPKALKAINAFADDMKKNGSLKDFDQFLGIRDLGGDLTQDAIRNAKAFDGAMQSLHATLSKMIDSDFSGPLKSIAAAINSLDPKTLDLLFKAGGLLVGGLATAVAGRALYKGGKQAISDIGYVLTGKRGGGADGAGGLLGGGLTPVPVYMVNAPNLASSIASGTGAQVAGNLGRLGKLGAFAAGAARVAVGGYAAYEAGHAVGTWIDAKLQESKVGLEIRDGIGSAIAHVLGILGDSESIGAISQRVKGQDFNGKLKITIDSQGRAHASRPESDNDRLILQTAYSSRGLGGLGGPK